MSSVVKKMNENVKLNKPVYKMGGPLGVIFYAVFFTTYTLQITLKSQTGDWKFFSISIHNLDLKSLFSIKVVFLVLCWFLAQCLLYIIPFGGPLEDGVQLQSGLKLTYRVNALFVLCLNVGTLLVLTSLGYDVTVLNNHLLQLLVASLFLCFIFSLYLYYRGNMADRMHRNPNGNTGNTIYDWFMGNELNPRWGSLDVKYVLFRSGIIGWILLNICNLMENFILGLTFNWNLIVLNTIQLCYVVDYFYLERSVIVSRDIVSEGLGYNILVQFVMIPFCFCVQTRYVLTTKFQSSKTYLLTVALLYVLGYYIYRASNSEKNNYRKNPQDPKLSHLKTMMTSTGKNLLVSGWWGMCRHPNYLGDIIISLSYALCTGFNHVVPYLGTIFLVLLLLDRERLDHEDCKRKYGTDWQRYCENVKYRIVPGFY